MSSRFHWIRGVSVAIFLILITGMGALAQGPWMKAAEFPEPQEELYGIAAGGKMYVIGGYKGSPSGIVYEYDPATDKWTKKKPMAFPTHHEALAEYQGKIYVFGGFISHVIPGQAGLQGWQPVDNAWQYDPVADSWKALPPMPTKRGSPVAQEVGGKIYVIGGAIPEPNSGEPALLPNRPARSVGTNEAYNPATNTWETHSPMPTARNHMYAGVVGGKIYLIGGRLTNAFITVASNLNIVEEYDPAKDFWGVSKAPMPTTRSGGGYASYGGKIYVAGGEVQTRQFIGAFRALEAYDPATNTWAILPSMPLPRHGVATAFLGNRLHLVSGNITSGERPTHTFPPGRMT